MRKLSILSIALGLSAVVLVPAAVVRAAETTQELAKENAELKQRVDRLEKELAEIKAMLAQQPKAAATAKPAAAPKLAQSDIEKIAAIVQGKKKPVTSSLDVEVYGRLKLDAAYDTSRTDTGNYIKWVRPEGTNENDNEFNMTANETRLGFRVKGPQDGELRTSGRVEVDFFEGGSENKSRLMMRHAYMKLDWPEDRFSILAGQTSDVISPLVPYTMNYSVAWWAGNIGYRRPQIRLTKGYTVAKDVDLKLEGALTRDIGINDRFVGRDAGEDSGIPGIQGRISATFPWLGYKRTTVGISSHWAKEEYDLSSTGSSGANDKYDSWSLNLDVLQPISEWLTMKGEFFTGQDLSPYLGGIGQGVNTTTKKAIGSTGGWVAACLTPCPKWNFNLGVSVDDPDNGDLKGMGGNKREYNRSVFGNAIYSLDNNAQVGFELSQWHTEYASSGDGNALRAQASFIYNF